MKFSSLLLLATVLAPAAHADMVKKATLDLTCTSADQLTVVKVVSNASGAQISLNGNRVLEGAQLIGGTEGGAPYLQAANGEINFTLSGGDFKKAIYADSRIENGVASASIWDTESNNTRSLQCEGLFSFEGN